MYGAQTDGNGYFNITRIPAGSYTLMVTCLGFDTLKQTIELKEGEVRTLKLEVSKSIRQLTGITVEGKKGEDSTETKISVEKITPKQISGIPTVGGQPDLAQYLQVLPGVIFTGDQGGQLYIRGGSPVQNKVLLDGMIIYNPFHSIGLFSVFDTDILRTADVYTGGFGAEYGGRISSVMDITTRDGNKKQVAGVIGASPFGSKLMIEGPLKKQIDANQGSTSFIFSAKNSYLKESSKLFYQYIDTAGLPFNFTDFYGKVSLNAANGSKVNFFGFRYEDKVNYKIISDFNWKANGIGTNFVLIPGSSPVLVEGVVAFSNYTMVMREQGQAMPDSSQISGFNIGMNFTYFLGKNELRYGVEMNGFRTNFVFFNALNRKIQQNDFTTELGGYVKGKIIKGKFIFEPSFRAQWYASLGSMSPEPRLAAKYNVAKKFRLKFAGGWYSQNLISTNSDRDIVNLFYGFLSGPETLPVNFDGKEVKHKLQKAWHTILGSEFDLINNMTLNVEGYYKDFTQLTNINRNKVFDDNEANSDKPDYLKKDFVIETGNAYGFDVSVKYEFSRIYLWGVYSLGYVNRYDGIENYVPHFDRRHNVNLVFSYKFDKKLSWEFDARWNLGSGFPFTQTQGYYEMINFSDGINTDYTTSNGTLGIQYAPQNLGRLPYYHRLDLTIKKTWEYGERKKLEANLGVTNAYNRENMFYFDRVKYERVNQLPIMPSAGITFKF